MKSIKKKYHCLVNLIKISYEGESISVKGLHRSIIGNYYSKEEIVGKIILEFLSDESMKEKRGDYRLDFINVDEIN